ncbi:MAG: Flp pilus assembly protein CpaB [Acidimicrobiales bacterium]
MRSPMPHRLDPALALRRRPRARRAVIVAVAALSGLAVTGVVQRAEDTAAAWGTSVPVLVAAHDLDAGDRLDAANTRVEQHPGPLVPDGALSSLPDDGRRLAVAVFEGEVLRLERLAPAGLSTVAARLPPGTRAMAVPVEPGLVPPLGLGDRVDVLVALAPEAAGEGPPGFALASHVLVVAVDDAAVTIAVPEDTAPRLAVAFGAGAVTLALTGAEL